MKTGTEMSASTQPRTRSSVYDGAFGLTVIELLIIIAALAVVILIAVPTSSKLLHNYRLKSASTDLVNGLNLARSEALRRASTVRVCPSLNGRFCRSDGDWSQGWLVYTDGNGDGAVQEIELIQAFEGPEGDVEVVARGAAAKAASFTTAGLAPTEDGESGEIILCYRDSSVDSRSIFIDAEGWVSLTTSAPGACQSG